MNILKLTVCLLLLSLAISAQAQNESDDLTDMLNERNAKPVIIEDTNLFDSKDVQTITSVSGNMIVDSSIVLIVILGTVLGMTKKTVIYTDYDDLMFSFGIVLAPVAMMFALRFFSVFTELRYILMVLPSLILAFVVLRNSWRSGVRLLLPVVFITKVVWAFLFVLSLLEILNPSGKNAKERRKNRMFAIVFTMVATPILVRLINNKESRYFKVSALLGGHRHLNHLSRGLRD